MILFLPLLGLALLLVGGAAIVAWTVKYLNKQVAKRRIQEQKREKFKKELSERIGGSLKKKECGTYNIGLNNDTSELQDKSKNELINILVRNYGYAREWIDRMLPDRMLQMVDELEGNKQSNNGTDWIFQDEESRKIFAGKYYNGEVVSMEEVVAEEIDPELQRELYNQEIVIL